MILSFTLAATLAGAGTRMIRGAPLEWRPDWIWGSFSGALG